MFSLKKKEQKINQPKKSYVAKESLKEKLADYNEITFWVAKALNCSFLLLFSIIRGAGLPLDDLKKQS